MFWPTAKDPLFARLIGDGDPVISSDHRMVFVDLRLPTPQPTVKDDAPATLEGKPFGDLLGARFLTPFRFDEHDLTLVRWWTNDCPFCTASLPALDQLGVRYAARGFAVVGMYHPKPPREVTDTEVRAFADKLSFTGTLAVDPQWHKLNKLCTRGAPERATSISVLVDRAGKIVWVHAGLHLHPSDDAEQAEGARSFAALEALLRARLR